MYKQDTYAHLEFANYLIACSAFDPATAQARLDTLRIKRVGRGQRPRFMFTKNLSFKVPLASFSLGHMISIPPLALRRI
jgi:hypothetical protein